MALPLGNFALKQVLPLWQNPGPIIALGKAAGLLRFGRKLLAIAVESVEPTHGIVDIDEGTTKAKWVKHEALHADGFSMPLDQFAAGRIVRGQRHHSGRGGLQAR